eukprot:jgi/Chlat1/5194/Chrsp33S05171
MRRAVDALVRPACRAVAQQAARQQTEIRASTSALHAVESHQDCIRIASRRGWRLPDSRTFASSAQEKPEGHAEKDDSQEGAKETPAAAPNGNEQEADDAAARFTALETSILEKDARIKDLQDKVLRSYAEMENSRDRLSRQAETSRKYAVQEFAKGLLDVADNLGRAMDAVPQEYRKGNGGSTQREQQLAKYLRSLFEGVFEKHGIERYTPLGEPFDPNLHEAAFEVPDPSKPNGTVGVVMKTGYKLHDRVVRPAQVGVVRNADE